MATRKIGHENRRKSDTPSAEFTKALKITGEDGYLGIRGEYHLKADLYEGFPRYEKIGVDPKKRKERRFLTCFPFCPGRWVFSDWNEFLLVGPIADNQTAPNGPDKYEGKYEVCENVKPRCKGVVDIKVTPLKNPSNVATSSSSAQQLPKQVQNYQDAEDDDSSDDEIHEDNGRMTCKKHRLELCNECSVNFVHDNKVLKKMLGDLRYVDEKGFFYCREHCKEICDICCESYSYHNDLLRARKPGQEVDEDACAVRDRLFKQMRDAIQDGTCEESDGIGENDPFDLSAAGRKKLCEYCGKKGTFKCKRCNFTYYCSEAHQAAHHVKHHKVCDQLDGVKLTRQMKDLLRWVGPPDSSDDDDGMDAIDFEPDADDPRFWGTHDDEDYDDEDEWTTDDEEDVQEASKPSKVSPIKIEAKTGPSVSKKDLDASASSPKASSSVMYNGFGSSSSGPKTNSNVPKKDSDSSPSGESKVCAHCGQGGKLSMCSRCKTTFYCSREHQVAHYASHKRGCRQQGEAQQMSSPPAKKPGVRAIAWEQVEDAHPFPAQGKTLEVRIISPFFLRGVCDGRDAQGHVRRLAFYSNQLPKGLKMGCVLRLRDPLFHYFLDGSCGLRIEDEDLPNITISDN